MSSDLFIGLMSGTSMDAIDCALVKLDQGAIPETIDFITVDIPQELRSRLLRLCEEHADDQIRELGECDVLLGRLFASAALSIIEKNQLARSQINAIGSHGQTVRHQPPGADNIPFTIQIADPNTIAALTGITTVADFRRKDMALDGQGAPLLPVMHQRLFRSLDTDRVVLNIGGMANLTFLRRGEEKISGFDTGPGNVLLDVWIQKHQGLPCDLNGDWAASGSCNEALLAFLLEDPYFASPPPKSTGREMFNLTWLENKLQFFARDREIDAADVQATLVELTTVSVAQAIKQMMNEGELIVCGGGAQNSALMQSLKAHLHTFKLSTSDDYGIDSKALEAIAFACFAQGTLQQDPIDLGNITGSSRPHILGGIYYAD